MTFVVLILMYAYHRQKVEPRIGSTLYDLFKESMSTMDKSHTPKVVLFGDSILNNSRYVSLGNSVGASLRDIYGANLKMYAQDGASINNVYAQLEQFSTYNNDSETDDLHIVISAGGNNMLNAMQVHALNDSSVDKIASQYSRLMNHVCKMYPNAHVYLLNVYYPTNKPYNKIAKYVTRWNDTVKTMVEEKDRTVLIRIDEICTEEEDFINDIEPSSIGGKKIADIIVQNVNEQS